MFKICTQIKLYFEQDFESLNFLILQCYNAKILGRRCKKCTKCGRGTIFLMYYHIWSFKILLHRWRIINWEVKWNIFRNNPVVFFRIFPIHELAINETNEIQHKCFTNVKVMLNRLLYRQKICLNYPRHSQKNFHCYVNSF